MSAHPAWADPRLMTQTRTVRITVRGQLSDRLATAFDGMTPVRHAGATDSLAPVADQAQLHGLLGRIRDLGLELESLSVSPNPEHQGVVEMTELLTPVAAPQRPPQADAAKRVVVEEYGGPDVLKVVDAERPRPADGRGRRSRSRLGRVVHRRADSRRDLSRWPEAAVHARLRARRDRRRARPGLLALHVGDRVGALTVWGADAELVCVPERSTPWRSPRISIRPRS